MHLSAGEKLRIQRLRAEGMSWRDIGKHFGCWWSELRKQVDVEWRERRARITAQSKANAARRRAMECLSPKPHGVGTLPPGRAAHIPAHVLAEYLERRRVGVQLPGRTVARRRLHTRVVSRLARLVRVGNVYTGGPVRPIRY